MADASEETAVAGEDLAEARSISTPVSVVLRKRRGVTRWAPWSWQAIGVLPEPAAEPWRVLREDEEGADIQVAAPPLELHRTDADAYRYGLAANPASLWVVAQKLEEVSPDGAEYAIRMVTASPYEAEGYLQGDAEIVERVASPPALAAWTQAFVDAQPAPEVFKKRRRGPKQEEGDPRAWRGDPRIRAAHDVYSAPGARRAETRSADGWSDENE